MRVMGVIPARYQSSRFPGKPLVLLLGKPMILHVAEKAEQAIGREQTCVATDHREIASVVEEAGFPVAMTTDKPLTGTDRVWEVAQDHDADIYLNVQGDEPMLDPSDILSILHEKERGMNRVVNGMCPLSPGEDPGSIHIPKVITTEDRRLVYMSRLPVPGFKSEKNRPERYMKQVCIYAFTRDELRSFGTFGRKSYLEEREDIEILRFLELGIPVHMVETRSASLAVDVPEDVPRVEAAMKAQMAGRTWT